MPWPTTPTPSLRPASSRPCGEPTSWPRSRPLPPAARWWIATPCCAPRSGGCGPNGTRRCSAAWPGGLAARKAGRCRSGLRRRRQLAGPAAPGLSARTPDGPGLLPERLLPRKPVCPWACVCQGRCHHRPHRARAKDLVLRSPCSRPSGCRAAAVPPAMWQWSNPAAPSSGTTSSSTTRNPMCAGAALTRVRALFPRACCAQARDLAPPWRALCAACTRRSTPSSTRCPAAHPPPGVDRETTIRRMSSPPPFLPFALPEIGDEEIAESSTR